MAAHTNSSPENPHGFKRKDFVDAQDGFGTWYEARIEEVEDNKAFVHYTFWESRYDEWIPLDSPRIAPHGTHIYRTGGTLAAGQKVDVFDTHPQLMKWLEAKVVDANETQVKVHFRGYAASLDEWLDRNATFLDPATQRQASRFAPFGHRSKHARPYRAPRYFYWRNRERRRAVSAAGVAFKAYKTALAAQGMRIVLVEGDGNCMFRSVSHQVYGTDEHHADIRKYTARYMTAERAYFSGWIADDFTQYIARLQQNGTWGDDPELQALSELYDRPIEVWVFDPQSGARVLKRLHEAREGVSPIRLSYYGGGHYDSIVGPGHGEGVLSSAVGQREEGMLRAVLLRNTPQGRAGLATAEQSELQSVLQASRTAYADQDSSIEAALRASLADAQGSGGAGADDAAAGDADLTAATVQASEVDATDDQLLRTVQADTEAAATQEAILQHLQAEARRKEEAELAAALAASRGEAPGSSTAAAQAATAPSHVDADASLAAALAASLQEGQTQATSSTSSPPAYSEDEMLQAALALSMADADASASADA